MVDEYLEGTLRTMEPVLLNSTARVRGDIHTPSLSIRDGAVFEGNSYFLAPDIYSEICPVESESDAQMAMAARV
jgi:cytoskeletal protein CcmA (bactofilin family)